MATKKPTKAKEVVITDIAREYFTENGLNMVKITKLNGKKVVDTEIKPTDEE